MQVGLLIMDYLKEHGTTQTFISQKTGIPASRLNLSLNGHRRLRYEEYAAICWALGVNTDTFVKPAPLPQ